MKRNPIPFSKSEYPSVQWHPVILSSPALCELLGLSLEREDKQSLILEAQSAETQVRSALLNWVPIVDPRQWETIRSEISARADKPSSKL